jgi:hypothetical protein
MIGSYEFSPADLETPLLMRHQPSACPAQGAGMRPVPVPNPLPGPAERIFPQTGQRVADPFLHYWQAHGGLEVFGYPLAAPQGETVDGSGQPATVQYFERAVFVYDPTLPEGMRLLPLGQERLAAQYPNPDFWQMTRFSLNPVTFPATHTSLTHEFRAYWTEHGGLATDGPPLTNEFGEVSDLDGKLYRVQYFAGAVYEFHPENPAPADVLRVQLGRLRYQARYGTGGTP